ncbi:RNA-binding protein 41-like [Carassius auratus]|uniref:RNA-binding protein 41-like n=1 Tax=Carassius auratus TaxID=7957 RepID=A0A6P6IZY7_CARAU|nr:RNA-binding protein 41-like [Carassius auratus]
MRFIERLQSIRDKISARAELLTRPQCFSSSQPLSRGEMDIEKALFQSSDLYSFLTALYHREEESPVSQQGATFTSAMDHFYKDFPEDYKNIFADISEAYLKQKFH